MPGAEAMHDGGDQASHHHHRDSASHAARNDPPPRHPAPLPAQNGGLRERERQARRRFRDREGPPRAHRQPTLERGEVEADAAREAHQAGGEPGDLHVGASQQRPLERRLGENRRQREKRENQREEDQHPSRHEHHRPRQRRGDGEAANEDSRCWHRGIARAVTSLFSACRLDESALARLGRGFLGRSQTPHLERSPHERRSADSRDSLQEEEHHVGGVNPAHAQDGSSEEHA